MVGDAMWIAAGYSPSSAHTRAAELLDWRKHPDIAIEIQDRLAALREAWDVNRDKHLAMLLRSEMRLWKKVCMGLLTKQRSCGVRLLDYMLKEI